MTSGFFREKSLTASKATDRQAPHVTDSITVEPLPVHLRNPPVQLSTCRVGLRYLTFLYSQRRRGTVAE